MTKWFHMKNCLRSIKERLVAFNISADKIARKKKCFTIVNASQLAGEANNMPKKEAIWKRDLYTLMSTTSSRFYQL